MADTPFFTQQWARHFSAPRYITLMPQALQIAFQDWLACCQSPPVFLTDTHDALGQRLHQNQIAIDAFKKLEPLYEQITAWLQNTYSGNPPSQASLSPKAIEHCLSEMVKLTKILTGQSLARLKISKVKLFSDPIKEKIRQWTRAVFLACAKQMIQHSRLNHRLHLTLLFQRQTLFLGQNPSYWRALIDKRALQNLCFNAQTSASTPSQGAQTSAQGYSLEQLRLQHQTHLHDAHLPRRLLQTYEDTALYRSVLDGHPQARNHARDELHPLQQKGICPSNKYQIMGHDQLLAHTNSTISMVAISDLMQTQIQHPPMSIRLWRITKKRLTRAIPNPAPDAPDPALPRPNPEATMLSDINRKKMLLGQEALTLLKTMLNRVVLCSETQQFTSDDTLWHLHRQLTHAGLALFSATKIPDDGTSSLKQDSVFVRESQDLIQVAHLCHTILHFPEILPQVRRLKNQLLALPLLNALPHLKEKPFTQKHLITLYYDTTLWTRIYQHYMALGHDKTLDIPMLQVLRQSLVALEDDLKQTIHSLPQLTQWRRGTKKAKRYIEALLHQLDHQCLQHWQRHHSSDYQRQLTHFIDALVCDLIQCRHDSVQQQLAPFANTDIALVPCEIVATEAQQLVYLQPQDIAEALFKSLTSHLEILCHQSLNSADDYQHFLQTLDAIEHCLGCAWHDFAQTCKKTLHAFAHRLTLLSACNPWHTLDEKEITLACEQLKDDNDAKAHIAQYLPISLAQAMHDAERYYPRYNQDHNNALLAFCGHIEAQQEYSTVIKLGGNKWLKRLRLAKDKAVIDTCPYPDLCKIMGTAAHNETTALNHIEEALKAYYYLEELLCTHVIKVICADTTDIHEREHLTECCLDGLDELIQDFAQVQLRNLHECKEYICYWISCSGEHQNDLLPFQTWMLGFSTEHPPLSTSHYHDIRRILMCLSQLCRRLKHHNRIPPSSRTSEALQGEVKSILSTTLMAQNPSVVLRELQAKTLKAMPWAKSIFDLQPLQQAGFRQRLFASGLKQQARESASNPSLGNTSSSLG